MLKSPHYAETECKFERTYTPERLASEFICNPERLSEYGYNTDWLAAQLGIARPYPEDVRHFLQNKLTYARRRACRHWRKVLGTGQTRYFVAYGAPAPTVCAGTVTNSLPRLAYPGKRPVYMARLVADGREVILDHTQVYATAAEAQAAADAFVLKHLPSGLLEQDRTGMPGTLLPNWPLTGAKKATDLTYYDGPLTSLFTWNGSRYVYLWVDQVEDGHRWLVYRITVTEVYSQRRLGVIAPPPADPLVYLVDLDNEAQPLRCAVLMPHELPDAYMPESGFVRGITANPPLPLPRGE